MKRKVLMMIFAVNIALAGCSGGRKTQPDPDTSSEPVEVSTGTPEFKLTEEPDEKESVKELEEEQIGRAHV